MLFVSAQSASITGIILDENNTPLSNVTIATALSGTVSDSLGFYLLEVRADEEITVTFSHLSHQKIELRGLLLTTNETYAFSPVMKTNVIQIDSVTVTATGEKKVTGVVTISPDVVQKIPGANAGIENVLKLLPGVFSNNELSIQYAVRGGNYDENLVYINDIEVYRPFLVRSGQQEGLSFVNSTMAQRLYFSAGGFAAKFGDKLSSVLDIQYKIPTDFKLRLAGSLLGGSATLETLSADKSFSSLTGIRYRDNSLLVNSQQTTANFNPSFGDLQSYLTYRFSSKFHLSFLGNLAINNYRNQPVSRQTNFGTITDPKALIVFYQGQEKNVYTTSFGALKADFFVNDSLQLKFISSAYHTIEEEYSDVIAQYELGEVETDLGSENLGAVTSVRGIGSQFNRSRNELDALIFNIAHKGELRTNGSRLAWGIKYTHEDIRDQIRESEFIDSAGFFIRPPLSDVINNEPEEPFNAPIDAYEFVNARNTTQTNRFSAYTQYSKNRTLGNDAFYYNLGIRAQYWRTSGKDIATNSHVILSPRAQIAIKPGWKKDMLFRFATGFYQQPPSYRELRNALGEVQSQVKAQKSLHFLIGNDYSFKLWERPFSLVSEAYYKRLSDVNTYTLEDVRVRYAANNNAKAYAYGLDLRLYGAFVPGTESWVSLGYLKTEENSDDRGFISRPTDQRIKVGILFQDYVPTIPNLKMYLNLVYSTGVPGGSPNYADPYIFQNSLRDYKRADLGISHIFADINN
ncbi:MAG: TonB-dependent receptor, partial [Eudoraea sp.]|nr:TonB-dependent receptor [Eudoraea sp.]